MNLTMIVDTLERVERLRRGLKAKKRAVDEANAEVASSGWNASGAKRKAAAAAEAFAAQATEIAELLADLPESRGGWICGRVAEIRVERSVLERRIDKAEKAMAEAEAAASVDIWKWKARGVEPKALVAARTAIADAKKALSSFDDESAETLAMFDKHATSALEDAEVDAWVAGGYKGERPAYIQRVAREFAEEMAKDCVRLPLPRKQCYMPCESDPDALEYGEWGTHMTAEEYIDMLMPPPPPPVVQEVYVSGTPAWMKRFLAAKKARAAAC
jgi:hypothetical protein